ncbi:MAG: sugar ABC transporter ATP-binding protein [Kineosporiaceae bacterium]
MSAETVATTAAPPSGDLALWQLQEIRKAFPGVQANDGIDLTLHAGQIHALLGENGCGKSTLIKILSGVQSPDSGRILHRGRPIVLPDPTAARKQGIATVYQEFSLVPQLSVAENIALGRHPRRRGILVDWPEVRRGAARILDQLQISVDPDARVSDLSVAEQQLVEIAKALSQQAELLILDEPTTALGPAEIVRLHELLRRMRERGIAILYISHRLDEVVELVDTVTVLKDGRVVSAAGQTRLDVDEIVTAMIGAGVRDHYPKQVNTTEDVVLRAEGLCTRHGVRDVSLDLRRGEVLGLGGLIGSGRTEIARAIFGADRLTAGRVVLDGVPLRLRSPADAIAAGIALVPENRKYDGLFANFVAGPNISMAHLASLRRGLLFDHRRERASTARLMNDLEITPLAATRFVNLISGGNQQKVLIARWLFGQARVVILDEPTQGIDVGAKLAVYQLINDLTRSGVGVILISSSHSELLALCDRVAIVKQGRVTDIRAAAEVGHADLASSSAQA